MSNEQGARGKGQGAWSMEHGAREGRALRNDPVGHFSEGASLQGRQGAWGKEHGARSRPGAKRSSPAKRESIGLRTQIDAAT